MMETRDQVENIILTLSALMNAVDMYGDSHRMTLEAIEKLYGLMDGIPPDMTSITIGVIGGEVAYDKYPFYELSKQVRSLISRMQDLEIEKITLYREVTKEEITLFAGLIARTSTSENIKRSFDSGMFRYIKAGKIGMGHDESGERPEDDGEDPFDLLKSAYEDDSGTLRKLADDIRQQKIPDVLPARRIVNGIMGTLLRNRDLLRILTSTKSHDESTFVHQINVTIFTLMQAESLGIEGEALHEAGMAALLHDAGKLAVSGDIIRKQEKLSDDDREIINRHPFEGARILLETSGVGVLPAVAAFEHHMRYDMTGYPEKVYGKTTNLVTMMIGISDFYDALRSERSYHEGAAPEEVYDEMIKLSGKLFHPDLVDNFFRLIGIYPPGSLVEMDTGEVGIVVKENRKDKERPEVEILYGPSGERVKDPIICDLTEKGSGGKFLRTISRSIDPADKAGGL